MRSSLFLTLLGIAVSLSVTGCSNLKQLTSKTSSTEVSSHPLKSKKDLEIERTLTSGTWKYQRQADDCLDTSWEQRFHRNRYYQSVGSACLLVDAFAVEAESWHVKNQHLYLVNLSPNASDDIILKYGIDFMDNKKLVLSSKGYKYTFLK